MALPAPDLGIFRHELLDAGYRVAVERLISLSQQTCPSRTEKWADLEMYARQETAIPNVSVVSAKGQTQPPRRRQTRQWKRTEPGRVVGLKSACLTNEAEGCHPLANAAYSNKVPTLGILHVVQRW